MLVSLVTAGLMALLLLILSFRISLRRRAIRVSIGDGGDTILQERIRAQGNLTEYLATILFLLFLAEQGYGRAWFVVAIAAVFILARICHAIGIERPAPNMPRMIGALGTYGVLLVLAVLLLVRAVTL